MRWFFESRSCRSSQRWGLRLSVSVLVWMLAGLVLMQPVLAAFSEVARSQPTRLYTTRWERPKFSLSVAGATPPRVLQMGWQWSEARLPGIYEPMIGVVADEAQQYAISPRLGGGSTWASLISTEQSAVIIDFDSHVQTGEAETLDDRLGSFWVESVYWVPAATPVCISTTHPQTSIQIFERGEGLPVASGVGSHCFFPETQTPYQLVLTDEYDNSAELDVRFHVEEMVTEEYVIASLWGRSDSYPVLVCETLSYSASDTGYLPQLTFQSLSDDSAVLSAPLLLNTVNMPLTYSLREQEGYIFELPELAQGTRYSLSLTVVQSDGETQTIPLLDQDTLEPLVWEHT